MDRRLLFALLMIVSSVLVLTAAVHGEQKPVLWSKLCGSCHDGKTAPGPEELRAAYKTADEFAEAVHAKGARCMNIIKNDEKVIRKIASEIGIGEGKE